MKLYTFKVTPQPRIHSHDSGTSAEELNQLIDVAEPLSGLNYTRSSLMDCLRQRILSDNQQRLRSELSVKFDEFPTKSTHLGRICVETYSNLQFDEVDKESNFSLGS